MTANLTLETNYLTSFVVRKNCYFAKKLFYFWILGFCWPVHVFYITLKFWLLIRRCHQHVEVAVSQKVFETFTSQETLRSRTIFTR